jgi:hypothetical protein
MKSRAQRTSELASFDEGSLRMNVRRVPGYPGLYREKLGKEDSRYRIVITRNKKLIQEYFFFGGARREAEARARAS